jgi:hypothetical protein
MHLEGTPIERDCHPQAEARRSRKPPSTNVIRTHARAYQRVFKVKPDAVASEEVKARTETRVELPLAYSPFNPITQRGKPLESEPDFRGLTQIVTREPQEPVVANYRIPPLVWLLMVVGAGTCLLGSTLCRHSNVRAWPSRRRIARKPPCRYAFLMPHSIACRWNPIYRWPRLVLERDCDVT